MEDQPHLKYSPRKDNIGMTFTSVMFIGLLYHTNTNANTNTNTHETKHTFVEIIIWFGEGDLSLFSLYSVLNRRQWVRWLPALSFPNKPHNREIFYKLCMSSIFFGSSFSSLFNKRGRISFFLSVFLFLQIFPYPFLFKSC